MRSLPALVLLLGCSGPDPSAKDAPDTHADDSDGTDSDGTDSADTDDSGGSSLGLDERPSNATCLAPDRPPSDRSAALTRVYPRLDFEHPVAILPRPGDDARLYVLEQEGTLRWFDDVADPTEATVALDIGDRLSSEGINEDGLLGVAFHPDFAANGLVYVNYTAGSFREGTLHTVVARYLSTDGGDSFDPATEHILLTVDQPFANHNGGHLLFGPDGYLYVGLGDGGSAGDPDGRGQDPFALLGKMLRIDVDTETEGRPYGIPADNPFADGVAGAPEVFAVGLRNPWRYSFDRATGELWVGDVGQDTYEEIDLVERGGNYGWGEMEGFHCYQDGCDPSLYAPPVAEVDHRDAETILGGYVYRGGALPELVGTYVFADTYRGTFWYLATDPETGAAVVEDLLEADGLYPSAMGEDPDGELLVVDWMGGGVYRLEPAGAPEEDLFPATLSATGCVDPTDPTRPASGLVPYGVNMPLWSDGAAKARWMALPDGAQIHVEADGTFTFPVGSVLMKEFSLGARRVETRLLVRHEDGGWTGYTYAWRADGSDADLLAGSEAREVEGQQWVYPARGQCLQCHTEAAGRVLGARVPQLNGDWTYPTGHEANQLDTLSAVGMFDAPLAPASTLPAWPTLESGTVEERARAYLDTNCAVCHVPGGTGGGSMDFRHDTPLADMNACDAPPTNGDLGVADARILAPGAPERSLVAVRMARTDAHRMPPVGSLVVDPEGVALLEEWIRSLAGCE